MAAKANAIKRNYSRNLQRSFWMLNLDLLRLARSRFVLFTNYLFS